MADLRMLKDRAAEHAAKGKLDKAADLLREALQGDPLDVATRQKLAEVLRRAGQTAAAVEAYRAVTERFARDGLLLKAIAISKTILELEPAHVETQSALAELYARRAAVDARPAPRARAGEAQARPAAAAPAAEDRVVAIPLGPGPDATATPTATPPPFARIVSAAAAAAAAGLEEEIRLEPIEDLPAGDEPLAAPAPARPAPAPGASGALPRVPIFSDLTRDAFVALASAMELRRAGEGERVLEEGEPGASFFVVATGRLAVSRRDERGDPVILARLGEGDFFGEMALLSGAPRSATVVAEEPSELLEFRAEVLLSLARRHPHLAASLRAFYRRRLLANAMAVSPLFRPFAKGDRKLVMERFRAREVREGEVLVREGEPSDGLYVVLDGTLDVLKRKGATEVAAGQLGAGDLFGEMSCLRKAPASATVKVRRGGTLLRLPRSEFDELVVTHPQILELVSGLTDERAESLDAILSGHAQWTEEGLVLF